MTSFTGGAKLQAKLNELARKLKKASSVDVGFMADALYPDGTSVALVAAIQDGGAPGAGIPPRPFLRNTIRNNEGKWGQNLGAALKRTDYDASASLGLLGQEIQEEIQAEIVAMDSPPLATATIAAKGFDKPLIDTSHMINSVTNKVNS